MNTLRRGTLQGIVAVAVLMASVAVLGAQQRNQDKKEDPNLRSVEGSVTDAQQVPVARAIVQLKDMRTLQIRSFVTQEDGTYHFAGLRTDTDYELKATLGESNSSSKRLSSFDSRKAARVILQLEKK
ncbi:MAG: carboxypeptidase-like regulatory domain-containing protein [Acidobacteriota bacterium]